MKYCRGTFSGYKVTLCAEEITVVGYHCTINGRLPDESCVSKFVNWGLCNNISDVRAFLGTIGVTHMFICNFAHHTHTLTILTRKDYPFSFGPKQIAAQDDLKQALLDTSTYELHFPQSHDLSSQHFPHSGRYAFVPM
jgi:hypothetical protein